MYLLDTNMCIYYFRGRYGLVKKVRQIGISNCKISEITIAELKYGVEKSGDSKEKNRKVIETFLSEVDAVSIFSSLDIFAREKARLSKLGSIIDDFDLLIGATAIANNLTLVTNNEKHFSRLEGIKIENWIK